jgi:hypothetical protein
MAEQAPIAAVLLAAGLVRDVRELLDRAPEALAGLRQYDGSLPPGLTCALLDLAPGRRLGRLELVPHGTLGAALRERIVTSGDPLAVRQMFAESRWGLRDRRRALAVLDPAAEESELLVRELLDTTDPERLRAAVVCPFPTVLRHVLRTLGAELLPAERLRALLSLLEHGGPGAEAEVRSGLPAGFRVPDTETDADADADAGFGAGLPGALHAAFAEGASTRRLAKVLQRLPLQARERLALHESIDWTVLQRAYLDAPFTPAVTEAVAELPDCPDAMRFALARTHPQPHLLLAGTAQPPPGDLLRILPRVRFAEKVTAVLVERSLGRTLSGRDLLRYGSPASAVLDAAYRALREPPKSAAALAGWEDFRQELAVASLERLGHDPDAWCALAGLVTDFSGTVPELLDAAAATRRDAGAGLTDRPPPEHGSYPDPEPPGAALLAALDALPTDAQRKLLPGLDAGAAHDLLVYGRWRPEWLDWATGPVAVGSRPSPERALIARHRVLPPEAIAPLAALGDPEVDAALLRQWHTGRELRLELLARIDWDAPVCAYTPGGGVASRPLRDAMSMRGEAVIPLLGSGDPALLDRCRDAEPLNSRTFQVSMLLGLWMRFGPEVRTRMTRLPLPRWVLPEVQGFAGELLREPDADHALRRLREEAEELHSAEALAARLRRATARTVQWIAAENYHWDWTLLAAEHAVRPFPGAVVAQLVRMPGCPESIGSAVRTSAGTEAGGAAGPVRALIAKPLTAPKHYRRTVEQVAAGRLSGSDLLRHAHPVLRMPTRAPAEDPAARRVLTELVRKHLDGNTEAWATALRLIPSFTGTLPELLATAEAMTD